MVDAREIAETMNVHMPMQVGEERITRDRYAVCLVAGGDDPHPAYTVVQRLRMTDDDVDAVVPEVRALLRERKRMRATWEIGPSSSPADLYERLIALGMKPFEEPVAAGMVLDKPLSTPLALDISAHRCESVDEYVAAYDVLNTVFQERANETRDARRTRAEKEIAADRAGQGAMFVATIDGDVVGAARVIHVGNASVLGGAATLPRARSRGVYRALLAERFRDAVRRGAPTLVIQAGAMSRPILERLGFVTVAEVRILLDDLTAPQVG